MTNLTLNPASKNSDLIDCGFNLVAKNDNVLTIYVSLELVIYHIKSARLKCVADCVYSSKTTNNRLA